VSPDGTAVFGGWYWAVNPGAGPGVRLPLAVPLHGLEEVEHVSVEPPTANVQVTPELVGSLFTVALKLATGPPSVCELNFPVMLTASGAVI